MRNTLLFTFLLLTLFLIQGCKSEKEVSPVIETIELREYETIIDSQSNLLAIPNIIKYDGNLFVYDIGYGKIVEIDDNQEVVREFGRRGRGPGEFLIVNKIFLTEEYLYIVDTDQLIIHKYDRTGELHSTFDFGEIAGRPTVAPPPVGSILANEIDNQPFVTLKGDIMLSTVNFGTTKDKVFKLISWEGNELSQIGDVPEGSEFVLDNAKLRKEASEGKIPSFYKANSFPIQDYANPDEYFIVYSSLPKIAKYVSNGDKLWERDIESIETDQSRDWFFKVMDKMGPDIRNRVDLEFYSSGICSSEGDMYLVANTEPVVIHQFNNAGELTLKYKFISEEVTQILDIDFSNKRIFVVSKEGEILAYDM